MSKTAATNVAAVGNIALSTGDRSNNTPNDPAALLTIWKTKPMHDPMTTRCPIPVFCAVTYTIVMARKTMTPVANGYDNFAHSACR